MKKMLVTIASIVALGMTSQGVLAKKPSQIEIKKAEFTAANTDTSDNLTFAELSAYIAGKTADRFAALDTNADGLVDADEFTANTTVKTIDFATEIFNLADADANSNLDADEFSTTVVGNSPGEIIQYFAKLDKNLDMLVSLKEYIIGTMNKPPHNHH